MTLLRKIIPCNSNLTPHDLGQHSHRSNNFTDNFVDVDSLVAALWYVNSGAMPPADVYSPITPPSSCKKGRHGKQASIDLDADFYVSLCLQEVVPLVQCSWHNRQRVSKDPQDSTWDQHVARTHTDLPFFLPSLPFLQDCIDRSDDSFLRLVVWMQSLIDALVPACRFCTACAHSRSKYTPHGTATCHFSTHREFEESLGVIRQSSGADKGEGDEEIKQVESRADGRGQLLGDGTKSGALARVSEGSEALGGSQSGAKSGEMSTLQVTGSISTESESGNERSLKPADEPAEAGGTQQKKTSKELQRATACMVMLVTSWVITPGSPPLLRLI
eukprot:scaffold127887_cov18-Tisochrysis_lutea.AAC.1